MRARGWRDGARSVGGLLVREAACPLPRGGTSRRTFLGGRGRRARGRGGGGWVDKRGRPEEGGDRGRSEVS